MCSGRESSYYSTSVSRCTILCISFMYNISSSMITIVNAIHISNKTRKIHEPVLFGVKDVCYTDNCYVNTCTLGERPRSCLVVIRKKSLKIPKRSSESVYRRTDNTMAKRKKYKRTNNDIQNIHIKLKI